MNQDKTDIRSLEYKELKGFAAEKGWPSFRADQIFSWMHEKCVSSFDEMTNIPKTIRAEMEDTCTLKTASAEQVLVSRLDGTRKYLFRLYDGQLTESVMMPYRHGNSICVSSQVGCAMGCAFCASTIGGLVRDLSASEILAQIYEIQKETGERVSNVVVMGMGEPLTNYDNVTRFVRIVTDEKALHISQRNITISTCGIVPAIRKLADEDLKITLALSLHAPNDEIRRSLMPVARKYAYDEVLAACDEYFDKTGRRVTFEYCLIDGVNDLPEHARELSGKLKRRHAHVNLIPVNPTPGNAFSAARERDIAVFKKILEDSGIAVTRRREMGRDINGACGQLRARAMQ